MKEVIPVVWQQKDYDAPARAAVREGTLGVNDWLNLPQMRGVKSIARRQVESFCGKCDNYGADGVCKLPFGAEDQPRYVVRGFCGYAEVSGVRGQIRKLDRVRFIPNR